MAGFRELFWGFLLLFDFRFNGVDLLPDVIGYLLFYNGLAKLEVYSHHFSTSRKLMIPLLLLSIPDIYSGWWNPGSPFAFVYSLLLIGLNLFAVYHLCNGVKELTIDNQRLDLTEKTNNRWLLYLVVNLISAVLTLGFSFGMPFLLFIALFISSIVALVLMMDLMKKCEAELEPES